MVIAQDESLSKHMRKMVHVGGTGGKGVLLTGKEICLQHFICSLVFNAVLALCPINRPAFPFSRLCQESQRRNRPSGCQHPGRLRSHSYRIPCPAGGLRGELDGLLQGCDLKSRCRNWEKATWLVGAPMGLEISSSLFPRRRGSRKGCEPPG